MGNQMSDNKEDQNSEKHISEKKISNKEIKPILLGLRHNHLKNIINDVEKGTSLKKIDFEVLMTVESYELQNRVNRLSIILIILTIVLVVLTVVLVYLTFKLT